VPKEGRYTHRADEETIMSAEENKAIGLDDGVTALTQLGLITKA
jgi:hypothetical protein